MMVLMFWLSRTLEMMQNDMRTSGIDVFLVYNWFLCKKSCLWTFLMRTTSLEFICVANECFVLFGCGRVQAECFWYLDVVLHVFVVNNNQHDSNQTACFISGSCRMFS